MLGCFAKALGVQRAHASLLRSNCATGNLGGFADVVLLRFFSIRQSSIRPPSLKATAGKQSAIVIATRARSTSVHIDYATELNEQQLAAVTAAPGPLLVIAGAGSG